MSKFTKVAVLLAGFAVLFCIFSCGSREKQEQANTEKKIELAKEDSIIKHNELVDTGKDSTIMIRDGYLIKIKNGKVVEKTKLSPELDSLVKIHERRMANYDSVGIDSLGRTIYMHKKDARRFK